MQAGVHDKTSVAYVGPTEPVLAGYTRCCTLLSEANRLMLLTDRCALYLITCEALCSYKVESDEVCLTLICSRQLLDLVQRRGQQQAVRI